MSRRWSGRSEDAPALRNRRVILYRLREQAALVAQPDRPRERGSGLAGNRLTFETVLVHEELGYLMARLELGHAAARVNQR